MGFDPDIPEDAPDELDGWEDLDEQQNYSDEMEALTELLAERFPSIDDELSQIQSEVYSVENDLDNKVESVTGGSGVDVSGPNSSSPTVSLDDTASNLNIAHESGSFTRSGQGDHTVTINFDTDFKEVIGYDASPSEDGWWDGYHFAWIESVSADEMTLGVDYASNSNNSGYIRVHWHVTGIV